MSRRALTHRGGPIETRGDAELLERALKASEVEPDTLTHGFHSYPARMHFAIARTLVEASAEDARILDPFCGSGTVLVEAIRARRASVGNDLNPIALRVADVKCALVGDKRRAAFAEAASAVCEASKTRVRQKADSRAPVSGNLIGRWDGHVLKELGGLYEEIGQANEKHRRALYVVLSAIVGKFSRRRSDTQSAEKQRRVGRFIPSEFFEKKAHELVRRWGELSEVAGQGAPKAQLVQGDARDLRRLGKFDMIISSPPYGGTFDYVDHHQLRAPWLGEKLDDMKREMGARRRFEKGGEEDWDQEVSEMLRAIAGALTPEGRAFLWVGDGQIGKRRVHAGKQIVRLCEERGLRFVGAASQSRPDFRGGQPRGEHLVELARR